MPQTDAPVTLMLWPKYEGRPFFSKVFKPKRRKANKRDRQTHRQIEGDSEGEEKKRGELRRDKAIE